MGKNDFSSETRGSASACHSGVPIQASHNGTSGKNNKVVCNVKAWGEERGGM